MKRKDCETAGCMDALRGGTRVARPLPSLRAVSAAVLLLGVPIQVAAGGTLRVWPSAVVVGDAVLVEDVGELRGFDAETSRRLAKLQVIDAPTPGGSKLIGVELIRSVLVTGGANLADTKLSGAKQCAVFRPASASVQPKAESRRSPQAAAARPKPGDAVATIESKTLRDAVVEHFNTELARYGGSAEVVFDRTSEAVLNLSGPAFEFKIRRNGQPLGLCPLEIDVVTDGRSVQTVPLVVQVRMNRRTVVARRTINQDATVQAADVELSLLTVTRLDNLGLTELSSVVGQRAKRVIPVGSVVEGDVLESVPLVLRGQLVTLRATAGAVRVVTTAKAGADGRLHERIPVRSVDDKKLEYDAVVTGPGEVSVGTPPTPSTEPRLAMKERRP